MRLAPASGMAADLASFALAGALAVSPQCHWTQPGANRFTGDLVKAVDHYADLPAASRARLKAKLAKHAYDDRVVISRQGIEGGRQNYLSRIQDMHFGSHRICRDVKVDKWPARRKVHALVYCDEGHCLMVPAACGNLSRIRPTRTDDPLDIAPAAGPPSAGSGIPGWAVPQGRLGDWGLPADPSAGPRAGPGAAPKESGDPPAQTATPAQTPWPLGPGLYPFFPPLYDVKPVIPEPPSWLLWLLGMPLVALAASRFKRHGRQLTRARGR